MTGHSNQNLLSARSRFSFSFVCSTWRLIHGRPPPPGPPWQRRNAGARWESLKSASKNVVTTKLRLPQLFEIPFRQLLPYLLLILIMFLGLGLRYHHLGDMSFDHDEMGLVAKSKGIYKLGFPYTAFANEIRWITTYEAVPYPLALSGLFFGYSEWSMRLPACIMGTLSIGVIALMGRRLFDWRTGLFTAFVYACMPLNIRWGQNAFYLSQCQLMTLLTCWFFYEAIRTRPFHRKLPDGCGCRLLLFLSFMGRHRLSPPGPRNGSSRRPLGTMVVVEGVPPLPLHSFSWPQSSWRNTAPG